MLDNISNNTLIWLLPIVFMIHDFEEIILLIPWVNNNSEQIKEATPSFLHGRIDQYKEMTTGQFAVAVLLEFILFVLAAFIAVEYRMFSLLVILNVGLFIHGVGHLISVIRLKGYGPFIITTILVIFPYCPYLFFRLLENNLITANQILISSVVGLIMFGPVILGVLKVSEVVYKNLFKLVKNN